jgi:hypothetical protein
MKFPNFMHKSTTRPTMFCVLALVLIFTSSFIAQTKGRLSGRNVDVKETADTQDISRSPETASALPVFSEVVEGANLDCKLLINRPNSTVVDPNELIFVFGGVYDDIFRFDSYISAEGPVNIRGTVVTNPPGSIHVQTAAPNKITTFGSQKPLTAVIINVGSNTNLAAYVFYYNPTTFTGGPLGAPSTDQRATNSLYFCYEPALGTTAAPATVAGRVVSADGMGLRGVRVSLLDASTGEVRSAITNGFGYYFFEDIPIDDLYVLAVSSKTYSFPVSVRSFTLQDNLMDMDFIAAP